MKRTIVAATAVLVLIVAGCSSSDPTASDGYQVISEELSQSQHRLAEAETALVEVTAERDALAAGNETSDQYEKSHATQALLIDIIENPTSFGTQDEVLDLVDELAVPLVRYEDTAWPPLRPTQEGDWRVAWQNTLFNDVISTITTWHTWLSDDGSTGGSLFTWEGTGGRGEPFELAGIELSKFNEDGLFAETIVYYPHTGKEVWRIVGWPPQ